MICYFYDLFLMTLNSYKKYISTKFIDKIKWNLFKFRYSVFFYDLNIITKKNVMNITVIVKVFITRILSSHDLLCQSFFSFFFINCPPCVHAASLGTTTHGCALTRPSLCRLSRQWGTDTGSDTIERDPSLLSLSITSMRRVCRRSWCSSTTHGPH